MQVSLISEKSHRKLICDAEQNPTSQNKFY